MALYEVADAPDSATKIRTLIAGDMVEGDIDGDGDKDAALILVHDPGGSGTFYYVADSAKASLKCQKLSLTPEE